MTNLTFQIVKKSCAFVIHMYNPEDILRSIIMFLYDRHIVIDTLNKYRCDDSFARLIICCKLERDRIHRTVQLLEELPGIKVMERMEAK